MKNKISIGVILLVVAAVTLLLVYRQANDISSNDTDKMPSSTKVDKPNFPIIAIEAVSAEIEKQKKEKEEQIKVIQPLTSDEAAMQAYIEKVIQESPKAKNMYYLYKLATSEIEFYGKITDRDNNPIPGVNIHFSIGPAYGIGQPVHNTVQTDDNGRYVIKGFKGASLRIYWLVKQSYRFPSINQTFYTQAEAGRPNSWKEHIEANPYKTIGWQI